MADMHHYVTQISQIVSTGGEEDTIIRGHRLTELVRTRSFVASIFLLLAARLPTPGEERTLDALLTSSLDHGITPAAMIGRVFASYGTPVAQALAGAVLLNGDVAGGVGDSLAQLMHSALTEIQPAGGRPDEDTIGRAAQIVLAACLAGGSGRVPGFGNPPHKRDPRPASLLAVAETEGVAGAYCRLLIAIERQLAAAKGKPVPANIDGVVAAVAMDLGLPQGCAAALVILSRGFSVLTHHLEERAQQTRWRYVPQQYVTYIGPLPGDCE
ncbi:MAG: citryl-CoA lyase [Burkholderiaceae bacterium]